MESFYHLEKALSSLNADELKHFERFIRSPYFTKRHLHNNVIKKLYASIKTYRASSGTYHNFDWSGEIEEITSRGITLKKNYVSKIKSEFLEYIMAFFVHESFRGKKFESEFLILNRLHNKGLAELFQHRCKPKHLYRLIEEIPEPERTYYYYKLCKLANEHKEKINNFPDRTDYFIEDDLLKQYLKKEQNMLISKFPCPPPSSAKVRLIYKRRPRYSVPGLQDGK